MIVCEESLDISFNNVRAVNETSWESLGELLEEMSKYPDYLIISSTEEQVVFRKVFSDRSGYFIRLYEIDPDLTLITWLKTGMPTKGDAYIPSVSPIQTMGTIFNSMSVFSRDL